MKKYLSFGLVLVMLLSLCACSASDPAEDLYGKYTLYAMDYEDAAILADELFEGENYIDLERGKAKMCIESDVSEVKWKLDGTDLTFMADDGDMYGSIQNGIITLDIDGTNMYFAADGASTDSLHAITLDELLSGIIGDPEGTDTPADTPNEIQQMWNGWWYGGIEFWNCDGEYESLNDYTLDVTMLVELGSDNTGIYRIYEIGGYVSEGYDENCIAEIVCHADNNYLYADSGTCFGSDIYVNDWVFVRNLADENLIQMGSEFDDETGRLKFDFSLMPWGNNWETQPHYQEQILNFDIYLECINDGQIDPYGNYADTPAAPGGDEPQTSGGASGGSSELLGSDPVKLDINDRGIVFVYYPGDQFEYNADYGKIRSTADSVGILFDPMLGDTNFDELKASYEKNNSGMDDYSLTETTVNGYKAQIMTYSDWLGATMRVDVDFGGSHDGYYGMSFCVSADSLEECDTDLIWAIIESFELAK